MRAVSRNDRTGRHVPEVNVLPEEYVRLLGYPRGWVLEGRARELADWAREWYAKNGRPWFYARQAEQLRDRRRLDSASMACRSPASGCRHAAAGGGAQRDSGRCWRGAGSRRGSAPALGGRKARRILLPGDVRLRGRGAFDDADRSAALRLGGAAGMAVLPHYSPGYPEWDVAEQPRLARADEETRERAFPSRVEAFDSGMLRPKKTLLAVFGLTRHAERLRRLTSLVPCERCSFGPCQYRRAPYRRAPRPLASRRRCACRCSTATRSTA